MSATQAIHRKMRLEKLDDLLHTSFFTSDTVDLALIKAVKTIAETLLDQEERITKLEAQR